MSENVYKQEQITIERNTKETQINLTLSLYASGISDIQTGIGFFNHMLEAFSKHSLIDINLICKGDLEIDMHHSVEDCGIVLGQALRKGIFPVQNIERFGNCSVVMDEACVSCDIDISNRAYLLFDMQVAQNGFYGKVGEFDVELVEEFFRALVMQFGISAHIVLQRGKNLHHIIESTFKAFAVSLRRAITKNSSLQIPSTKGCL
ncbi:imidazoleglycerol-phosphate dehydratase HisB [Helicobacter trogontum]|nr:imidazoleglycerol-phosphate dehydratase HisB [Helicobacter trogontum]MCI5786269.1 imidazoleglycerol-phosphate dehydratase HisB [Helicobacter trogontum]MDY5185889.1 imidazoleglycerol-phosphate dehydratase HisB [Helicobacter trogontum]TLD98859.1 imidazoleglycerol-phosphate dehydratase HisB [Helicobacter trogontum]